MLVYVLSAPIVILLLGAFKKDRPSVEAEAFSRQTWTYADAILAMAIWAVSPFLGLALPHRFLDAPPELFAIVMTGRAIVVTATVYLLLRVKHKVRFSALGFRGPYNRYYTLWSLSVALGILCAIGLVASLIMAARHPLSELVTLPGAPVQGSTADVLLHGSARDMAIRMVVLGNLVILGPFVEEVLFRGVLSAPLVRRFGPIGGLFLSVGLWAGGHSESLVKLGLVIVLGPIFFSLYQRTQSLAPSLTFHIAVNGLGVFARLANEIEHSLLIVLLMTGAVAVMWLVCLRAVSRFPSNARPSWATSCSG